MDIEKPLRELLVQTLSSDFDCYQECHLKHAIFDKVIRADVVAISKDINANFILAFEVKVPNSKWEFKHWNAAIAQAADYPFATIEDQNLPEECIGRTVDCAFVFPRPDLSPCKNDEDQESKLMRSGDAELVRGALLLAQHMRVGTGEIRQEKRRLLSLRLGTDTLWQSNEGFRPKAKQKFSFKRVGSQIIQIR